MDINKLNMMIDEFVNEREWEKFHSPKNLSMALSVEASELLEIFQWQNEDEYLENNETIAKAKDEIADIFYYLLRISKKLNIDIENSFIDKMEKNKKKYPSSTYKGNYK
jgi:NTP pyrophosphatase (non-canonical NTP hydrolase)